MGSEKKTGQTPSGPYTVELLSHNGKCITVKYLDAINGTPILDIKPVFKEFGIKSTVKQPSWVADRMKEYW